MQTVTLSLFRFDRLADRLWVLGQMALARPALAATPGLRFWKLCGSGTGEGFTPRPNWGVWAILCAWEDAAAAGAGLAQGAVFRRWRARADEAWTVHLSPLSARGAWAGALPFLPAGGDPGPGPLAVLTRATVRLRHAARFWARVPRIEDRIGADPAVLFKIGIGEVPLLHQVTFSIWPDAAAMAAFARADGPHAAAIRAVRAGGWFREELYARFRVLGAEGRWAGGDPLARPATPASPTLLPGAA
jgi:spheroidene monooxygenase